MLINVPPVLVQVNASFISQKTGFINAYLVAVRCIKSRPLLFTVHLENGALYAGLPINSLFYPDSSKNPIELEVAQPWSCLEAPANALVLTHVKDYDVQINSPTYKDDGTYLFTIDYSGDGLAQDPEQHKAHNIIATADSSLVAMPNNYCLFKDKYFTGDCAVEPKDLRRQTKYWTTY